MPTMMMEHARFADRATVGRALAEVLDEKHYERPVVLALPRGGVPVAVEIARRLHAPIDLLLVRKIGAPGHEELALGAVVDGPHPQFIINEGIRRAFGVDDAWLERTKAKELVEIERRRSLYLRDREPVALAGSTAIVVDDGIATGATVRAGLEAVRLGQPAQVIIAIGVASTEIAGHLRLEVDDLICLAEPDPMHAVGLYYEDFRQISDEEVVNLLAGID